MHVSSLAGSAMSGFLSWLLRAVTAPAQWALNMLATSGELHYLWGAPWAQHFILAAQAIAGTLLAVRVAWDAFQLATLRAEGAPTDPGGLFKRAAMAACAIVAGPWLAEQMLLAGNAIAQMVAHLGLATSIPSGLLGPQAGAAAVVGLVLSIVLLAVGLILVLLCFCQSMVRSIEMLLAALLSPVFALGFMSDNGGMASAWFTETLILACTQAVQITLLYVGATFVVSPGAAGTLGIALLRPFLFVAACWVAFRTPHVLRQYVYHSGAGGATSSVASSAVGKLAARLPF